MTSSFSLLPQLLFQPRTVFATMRQRPPVLLSFLAAWAASALYCWAAPFLLLSAQSGNVVMPHSVSELMQSGFGPQRAILWSLIIVLFIAAIQTPLMILTTSFIGQRRKTISRNYSVMVSGVLSSWTMATLISLLPAVLIGWLSMRLSGEAVVGYAVLLFLLPLPIFAGLNATALSEIFSVSQKVSLLIALLSLIALIAVPVLLQSVTIRYISPILLLIVLWLLFKNQSSADKQN